MAHSLHPDSERAMEVEDFVKVPSIICDAMMSLLLPSSHHQRYRY